MSIWKNIKARYSAKKLKQDGIGRRDPMVINLHHARSIGFLYHSTDEATYILVKQFAERITSLFGTRKTLALAYVTEKVTPNYHAHVLHSDYFTKKELNWHDYPTGIAVENFCSTDFDILIDISDGKIEPLANILERSTARFKIGREASVEAYDLIIPMKSDATLDQYLKRIINLLSNINHESSKIA